MWPEKIMNGFRAALAHPGSDANEAYFHGCWNKLFYTLFPPDTDYQVTPQFVKAPKSDNHTHGYIDLAFVIVVHVQEKPVMFLELKAPCRFKSPSGRAEADDQMRERFRDLMADLELPKLIGVSAFGTHLAFYEFNKATRGLQPARIPRDNEFINEVAPVERWDCDLLEQSGYDRLTVAIREVKEMCAVQYGV